MKICVLGNSHAGALKLGYDALGDEVSRRCEVTFFASRGDGLRSLVGDGGRLVSTDAKVTRDLARTSGGLTAIEPDTYDLLMIHALEFRYDYALLQSHAYTQGFVAAWMWQSWMESTAFHVLQQLQALTRREILLSPQPYASAGDQRIKGMVSRFAGVAPTIDEIFARCRKDSACVGLRMLQQPAETLVGRVLTKPGYSRGSLRLDVGDKASGQAHPDDDHRHMNAEFGAAVWRQFVRSYC
jgi:hypothetical protein